MTRRYGTIGHRDFNGMGSGLAAMALLAMVAHEAKKPRKVRVLTAAEQAERDKRTERQRWNDEVEARRAGKKLAKGKAQ